MNDLYEIEHIHDSDFSSTAIFAMLTGLPMEELKPLILKQSMRGSEFREIFRKLGYNTNNRFIPFDPKTQYPCMMRGLQKGKKGGGWYAWVYYNNNVYFPDFNYVMDLDKFIEYYDDVRITSMLQVWI